MKILIIIGSFKMGGAERMSINTGEELLKRGYDVHYIIQRPIFEIPNSISKERITVLRNLERDDLYYKFTSLFFGVFKASRKIKPDVIIGFSRFSSFLANFTFHSKIYARMDAFPYRMSKKQRIWADIVIGSPLVKKIIVPSNGMLKAFSNVRPWGKNKFTIIPNSINASNVLERAEEYVEPFGFDYISAMGRFSPQKNFEMLIRAFSKSQISNKFKLVIIGDGGYRGELEELVSDLKLRDKIVFTGNLSNPFPIIKKSKFFVNPSKFESFGNVILEALLLGKPVIATDCNYGPSDMIENGFNGALISDDNIQELVEKLNEWGGNQLIVEELSENAYNSALRFDIKNVGDMWQDILKKK